LESNWVRWIKPTNESRVKNVDGLLLYSSICLLIRFNTNIFSVGGVKKEKHYEILKTTFKFLKYLAYGKFLPNHIIYLQIK
jgi:hypothetical protein